MLYGVLTSCLIGAFLVLYLLKKKGRHLTIISILIGFGISGWVGGLLGGAFSAMGGIAFGLVIPAALSVFVILWLFFDIKERRNHKWTPWIGLVAASVIAAGASSGLPILQSITDGGKSIMDSGNSSVQQAGR